jgi:hypothetical protein
LIQQEIAIQAVIVLGLSQQIRHGRLLKYGELAVTVAEFVVVCKGLVEVQVATVVKWAK